MRKILRDPIFWVAFAIAFAVALIAHSEPYISGGIYALNFDPPILLLTQTAGFEVPLYDTPLLLDLGFTLGEYVEGNTFYLGYGGKLGFFLGHEDAYLKLSVLYIGDYGWIPTLEWKLAFPIGGGG